MTTNNTPAAKFFTAADAPADPFTGAKQEGWYFSDENGEEAEHYARMARDGYGVR